MADIINDLATKSGISPDLAKKGLGTVLSLLKDKLPEGVFAKVQGAIPGAEGLMQDASAGAEQESRGFMGAVSDMAGKLFGGGSAAAMASKLAHCGFSTEQLEKFVPNVLEFLKSKLPGDALKQITALLPIPTKTAS
jgi:hypothetical protein